MIVEIPMSVPSVSNVREHWAARARRAKSQRTIVAMVLRAQSAWQLFPCTVRLTRIAPRKLDSHDNLRTALKATVDGIADWLGVDDRSPEVRWEYAQLKGKPKYQAVRVELVAWNAGAA